MGFSFSLVDELKQSENEQLLSRFSIPIDFITIKPSIYISIII